MSEKKTDRRKREKEEKRKVMRSHKLTCSLESSSTNSIGNKSERVEKSCPTLMNVGPN